MDLLGKGGAQQKKSKKSSPTSRKSTVVPAMASAGSAGVAAPSTGGRSSSHPFSVVWDGMALGGSFASESSPTSSEWLYPPGGFVNSLRMPFPYATYPNGSQLPENSHFVGCTSNKGTPSPTNDKGTPIAEVHDSIDIDADDTLEPARTDKRLNWSHEEDVRLVSSWLQNSLDPVDGNDKKSDYYWTDVTNTYNSTTPSNRRRNRNQLKIRWDRVKKPLSEFHGCWVRTTRVFQSGQSDDQRTDNALQLYASEHNGKPFLLQHIWRVVRHERKWAAYVDKLINAKDNRATPSPVVNVEDSPTKRPTGKKKAKEERFGKRKAPEAISAIGEKLEKFIEASSKAEKMAQVQQCLADKKLEVAKINHKAAQEQTKCKMIDLYKDLLCGSTAGLSEEALAERSKALECMRLSLFAPDN